MCVRQISGFPHKMLISESSEPMKGLSYVAKESLRM